MAYHLGKVKPWVADAADELGHRFNIATIGGWRAHGSVPNSDHPKGLALDYMTRSKAVGDRLADFAVKNYKTLGITYVIWWRQIWTPAKGWHPYHGPVPHTDHVHVSFGTRAPKGGKLTDGGGGIGGVVGNLVPNGIADGVKGIGEGIKTIADAAISVGKVADVVASAFLPTNIVRGVAGLAGTMFILIGIFFLSREARTDG